MRNSCRQDDPATTALSALGEALPGDLVLREADLLNPGDFDDIVEGCSFVFHVASPFGFFDSKNPKHDLLDPAILGTQNVLSSVVKHKSSVKRVILTSSVAGATYL